MVVLMMTVMAVAMAEVAVTRKFFLVFIAIDVLVVIFSLIMQNHWLVNTQVAFFCSLLITIATFFSYKKMVQNRIETSVYDNKDALKKYEDPFDLYDDEDEEKMAEEAQTKPVKKLGIKESVRNLSRSYKGALSPLRLGAYAILIISSLFLVRHGMFDAVAFFVGLSIVPLGSLVMSFFKGVE